MGQSTHQEQHEQHYSRPNILISCIEPKDSRERHHEIIHNKHWSHSINMCKIPLNSIWNGNNSSWMEHLNLSQMILIHDHVYGASTFSTAKSNKCMMISLRVWNCRVRFGTWIKTVLFQALINILLQIWGSLSCSGMLAKLRTNMIFRMSLACELKWHQKRWLCSLIQALYQGDIIMTVHIRAPGRHSSIFSMHELSI